MSTGYLRKYYYICNSNLGYLDVLRDDHDFKVIKTLKLKYLLYCEHPFGFVSLKSA